MHAGYYQTCPLEGDLTHSITNDRLTSHNGLFIKIKKMERFYTQLVSCIKYIKWITIVLEVDALSGADKRILFLANNVQNLYFVKLLLGYTVFQALIRAFLDDYISCIPFNLYFLILWSAKNYYFEPAKQCLDHQSI